MGSWNRVGVGKEACKNTESVNEGIQIMDVAIGKLFILAIDSIEKGLES